MNNYLEDNNMDLSKNISENIKKLRESQHLTQEQLANSLGISYQA
ncbi:MAG: helix-turn-helix transcriptional regulator, partial [Acetatifactor sp.]|nr:helix-turn-helix transcriptional regulator [Acetatifactor sp.]